MESILLYYFHCVFIYLWWGWAAMNLPTGTLTTQRVARLDTYMREHMYATVYVARMIKFFLRFVMTYGTCIHHVYSCHYIFASLPPLSLIIPL